MDLKKLVEEKLGLYLPRGSEEPKALHMAMRYSVFSGGKRIRPVIVLESCKACGGRLKDALPMACAAEMVHTYSLIHDDLPSMDDDDYRRGRPSCHKKFGEAVAILAGDALLTLAFNIIASNAKENTAVCAIKELSEAISTRGMVGGQAEDIAYKGKKKNRAVLSRINVLKTARLFEACAKLGAIAAGSDYKKIKLLASYGRLLGTAFQMVDDIMDERCRNESSAVETKADALNLLNKAKGRLKVFGRRSAELEKIADFVLTRKN